MQAFRYEDARFDNAAGWAPFHRDASFVQRYLPDSERIFCETVVKSPGTVEEAIRLLRGPWDWWEHGRSIGYRANDDGSASQVLAPVWWHITRVGVQIFPPQDMPGGMAGVRLPMLVSRHFRGTASLDIYAGPGSAGGGVIIRQRYQGVENHIPMIPIGMATRIHLRAEAGNLTFPFPAGTGFPGLRKRLAAGG